jgi:epoxyqueuosine reductase
VGLFSGVETADGFEPSWLYKLFRPKKSGNEINGLGETNKRWPTPIYHRYDHWHPWILCGATFMIRKILTPEHRKYFKRMIQLDNEGLCGIATLAVEKSAEQWSSVVKEKAIQLPGCDVVGIAKLDPIWVFDNESDNHTWIIVFGLSMDYGVLKNNLDRKTVEAEITVLDTYIRSQEAAFELADWIRQQGYEAKGVGGPKESEINNMPATIAAGLGQLGKHGSLMNETLGSCFRMSYVLTDLPLVADEPVDIGVDLFCESCQLCTKHYPPNVIFPEKQLVRGEMKWFVDFDKCIPFFNDNDNDNDGCGICISTCPWARSGLAPSIVQKMLRKKARMLGAAQ